MYRFSRSRLSLAWDKLKSHSEIMCLNTTRLFRWLFTRAFSFSLCVCSHKETFGASFDHSSSSKKWAHHVNIKIFVPAKSITVPVNRAKRGMLTGKNSACQFIMHSSPPLMHDVFFFFVFLFLNVTTAHSWYSTCRYTTFRSDTVTYITLKTLALENTLCLTH